ncbi:MAG: LTA synthase family protein, partial [Sphingobacteriaceae bacterium]
MRFSALRENIYISLVIRLLIILLLYTVCRIAFYLFNQQLFPGIDIIGFLNILRGGIKFDISAILYVNSLFILSQILPFKFRHNPIYQKVCAWIFYITNGIALAFNVGDIAYYPFTLKRTSFTLFSQFANEQNKTKLFFQFLLDYWYITMLLILVITLMVFLYKRTRSTTVSFKNNWLYYGTSIILIPLIAGFVIAGMRGGFRHSTRPITLSNAGEFVKNASEISIVLNTPFSLIRTIKAQALKKQTYFDEQELNAIYTPVHPGDTSQTPFMRKNVVILILESFSREYLGAFNQDLDNGKYQGYTPFLDSLTNESLAFTNAYANGRKSIEGLPSVISSIPGIYEPFVLSNYSGNRINSFGNLLAKEGYHTSFFHGAPNGSMGFSSFVNLGGIEHYYGMTEYGNDDDFDGMWGIWDEPFMQFWANNLNRSKKPFFSVLFSVSSHHPFKVPKEFEGKFPKGTLPVHQGIGYTDYSLRQFFKTASSMPWYKNTLFVITADHSSASWHREYQTSLGAFAVPILIFDPSGKLKGRDDRPVQQIDILPTVLNQLHYKHPYFAFGGDMINQDNNHAVIHSTDNLYQTMMGDYVLKHDGKEPVALFNYKNDKLLT